MSVRTWIETVGERRERGAFGLVHAWLAVVFRPHRFFTNAVVPGKQAPGLTFAVAVAAVFTAGWIASDPTVLPGITDSVPVTALVVLLVVVVLAAPVGLHVTAAVGTVALLVASVERRDGVEFALRRRGGISETVQLVAYASAPLALAGPPVPILRVACAVYASGLLLYGIYVVHDTSAVRTVIAGLPPAVVGFGVGYRGISAVRSVLGL